MKDAKDLIPWTVIDLAIRPFDGFWSFNPSIHFDGALWRCVLRCCDYAMPDGKTIRSKGARSVGQQTKNAMLVLDPQSWKPIQIYKMLEKDGLPRTSTPHVGYEDMRLFKTDKGGLQGIAASLHLQREKRSVSAMSGAPKSQPPEQVVLSFDNEYNIVLAQPIRGAGSGGTPEKNWVPFDHCAEPRFLYSIDKGTLFDTRGPVHGDDARVQPSTSSRPPLATPEVSAIETPPSAPELRAPEVASPIETPPSKQPPRNVPIRGGDARIVRGGRMKLDAGSAQHSAASRPAARRSVDDSTRLMGTGRVLLPKYNGLRGGTQLVRVSDDAWLGIGHEMKFVGGKKMYWHVFYLVDSRGKLTAVSEPCKLAPQGIEFAAGMAIDGDRVVVSFGVDDMNSMLGETSLSAVLEILKPIAR